jgi:hypothetical protein
MKGDVVFEVEGVQYRMVLDFNALCDVETVLGEGVKMTGPTATRAVIWAGLQRHHAGLTLTTAGDLIGAMGMPRAAALVSEAMTASGMIGGEESADPRQPKAKPRASRAR